MPARIDTCVRRDLVAGNKTKRGAIKAMTRVIAGAERRAELTIESVRDQSIGNARPSSQ